MEDKELYDQVVREISSSDEPMSVVEIADTLGVDSCDVLRAIESNSQKFVLDIDNYDPRTGPKVHLKEDVQKRLGDAAITVNEDDDVTAAARRLVAESLNEIVDDVVQSIFLRMACDKITSGLSELSEMISSMEQDETRQRTALLHLETALAATQSFVAMFDGKEE